MTPVYAGASFAENFYGLKRRRVPLFKTDRARSAVNGVFPEEKLRNKEIWRSLLFLVSLCSFSRHALLKGRNYGSDWPSLFPR